MGPDYITSLGFVMHDPNCVAMAESDEPINGGLNELNSKVTNTDGASEEDSDETLIVVLVILGVLLLAGGGITGYFLHKRR